MPVCEYCGKEIPAGRVKYCGALCMNLGDSRKKRERRQALRDLQSLHPCSFNSGVDCPDRSACAACGWNPEVAAERLAAFWERT